MAKLIVESDGPVARVRLNRPEVLNAMDPEVLKELTAAYRGFAKGRSVRVAILSGSGRDFCAGADIHWMRKAGRLRGEKARRDARNLIEMCRTVDEAPCLTLARIQGNCFGGGLGLALACDVVVAGESARFCFSESRLGILPAVVSTFAIPKLGLGRCRRWFLTSEPFGAGEACAMGLAHASCADKDLDAVVDGFARRALRNAPGAIGRTKQYLREMADLPRPQRIVASAKELAKIRASAEAQEGFAAFIEKRKPSWAA